MNMRKDTKTIICNIAVALLLTACTDSASIGNETGGQTAVGHDEPAPISFATYTQRANTRAGLGGEISTAALKTGAHKDEGFGVFGYYHNDYVYDGQSLPDFMYNQKVAYKAATGGVPEGFYYDPLRYWPNETGANAVSESVDRVSFFAYAPYVAADADTGIPTGAVAYGETGITAVSRNRQKGDPTVSYRLSTDPDKSVDLCWAEPVLNKTRMDYGGGTNKVMLQFHHALAKLNVTVDAQVDNLSATDDPAGGALTNDGQTRIYVRSITFTGLATEGALNLNNSIYSDLSKARWQGADGSASINKDPVTIHDGRYDGQEGMTADEGEALGGHGLNSDIIQSTTWNDANATPGVTRTARNLFGTSATTTTAPVYVIPTGEPMTVTIEYDIETADDLAEYVSDGQTNGISVGNRITRTITTDGSTDVTKALRLESGKAYTVNLHLGLNSVKFDADVTDWESVDDLKLWSQTINYSGSAKEFTVTEKGRYLLEAYGASGGAHNKMSGYGRGGYSSVIVELDPAVTPKLYVYVGGQGGDVSGHMGNSDRYGAGGWNGGASGGKGSQEPGGGTKWNGSGGGGGATHIATTAIGNITATNNLHTGDGVTPKDGLLLVAGGGGGRSANNGIAGPGGGETGGLGRTHGNANYFRAADAWKNGTSSMGAAGVQGSCGTRTNHLSCSGEGTGGGGGGFIGGNTLTTIPTASKMDCGGCGGSGWVTPSGTKGKTVMAGNPSKGNGRVVISFLGSATDLPSN